MNKKKIVILILGILINIVPIYIDAQIKREHRSVWISAYVNDWPTSPITQDNAYKHKEICRKILDSLAVNNMTTLYYHVRAMSDAMYDSAYEPWSSYVSPQRGVAPAFDPFAFILEEGHKRGIEVYAWVNPYRYGSGTQMWGGSDRDYVNTHPEWLLTTERETVLNPGIPEVKERIKDVILDIITKYNVDGIIFDDYFYNGGGVSMTADADLYDKYVSTGGKLSQADWRRENVNTMVREVNQVIKKAKPHVRFGISPAGIAGTASTSAAKYGVKPSPGSDWQYNQIYSDPLAWISEGSIDFISPQVYWPVNGANDFDAVTEWWSYIAKLFNRQFYVSQSVGSSSFYPFKEFSDEVLITRNHCEDAAPGTVYFKLATYETAYEKFDGKFIRLPHYLKRTVFANKALTPALPWMKPCELGTPASVAYNNGVVSCTPLENARYVVYAVPNDVNDADFRKESEYLLGVSYEPTFAIPENKQNGYRYAMAYLDGYGNEYSAVFVDATIKELAKPVLSSPINNTNVSDLFEFAWGGNGQEYMVTVCEDAEMTKIVTNITTDMTRLSSTKIPALTSGKKYYWRVISMATNSRDAYSDIYSFTPTVISIISPAPESKDVSLTPTISWTPASDGCKYKLEIGKDFIMSNVILSEDLTATNYDVPKYRLSGGTKYYLRVTAMKGDGVKSSEVIEITTADVISNVPVILTPSEGATMYNDSRVNVEPQEGVLRVRVEIASTTSFPSRASYIASLDNFIFNTDEMNAMKISGKPLVNGNTYYVQARAEYSVYATNTVAYTEYSSPISFVYNSESGVTDVIASDIKIVDNILIIPMAAGDEIVEVYSTAGALIDVALSSGLSEGYNEINLGNLDPGIYLIKVKGIKVDRALKYIK